MKTIFDLSKEHDIWCMIEKHPTGKEVTQKKRALLEYEPGFQIHNTVNFTWLHILLLSCVSLSFTVVSVCRLTRQL